MARIPLCRVATSFNKLIKITDQNQMLNPKNPSVISYWVMGEFEQRGKIHVARYKEYWWSYAGSEGFRPSSEELTRAYDTLTNGQNDDRAILILESIVKNYPGTLNSEKARVMLEEMVH